MINSHVEIIYDYKPHFLIPNSCANRGVNVLIFNLHAVSSMLAFYCYAFSTCVFVLLNDLPNYFCFASFSNMVNFKSTFIFACFKWLSTCIYGIIVNHHLTPMT